MSNFKHWSAQNTHNCYLMNLKIFPEKEILSINYRRAIFLKIVNIVFQDLTALYSTRSESRLKSFKARELLLVEGFWYFTFILVKTTAKWWMYTHQF